MSETFGSYIRKHRREHERTLGDCAEELEVSTSFLAAVERGQKQAPSWLVKGLVQMLKMDRIITARLWLEGGPTLQMPKRGEGPNGPYRELAKAVLPFL